MAQQESPFSIPAERSQWVRLAAARQDMAERAQAIVSLLKDLNAFRVASVGVGCGWLEWHLKRLLPTLELTCTDYAPATVERLRRVFVECDCVDLFDMLTPHWPPDKDAYLLHCVDTELSDRQWKGVIENMRRSGIQQILMIPSAFLDLRLFLAVQRRRLKGLVKRGKTTFAGYLRTKDQFRALWSPSYPVVKEIPVGNVTGFLLHP